MAYRSYDHRVRNAIAKSQHPDLFPELNIPKSTAKILFQRDIKPVVTSTSFDLPSHELIQELETVKDKLAKQEVSNKLTVTVFRIFGFQIQYKRLPLSDSKTLLISAASQGLTRLIQNRLTLSQVNSNSYRVNGRARKKVKRSFDTLRALGLWQFFGCCQL